MSWTTRFRPPTRPARSALLAAGVVALCVLVGALVFRQALHGAIENDRVQSGQRLAFYAQTLEAGLARYETLPGLLALDHDLATVLQAPTDADHIRRANTYLETAQARSGVTAAYLMDAQGRTLAASNWNQSVSFVGQSYAFRPYFRAALAGAVGRLYAIGATSGEPGYFLAAPVLRQGRVAGVVAIKVALQDFEKALNDSGDQVLLADALGVVFMATQPDWHYHSLAPLPAAARSQLETTRQYGAQAVPPLFAGDGLVEGKATVQLRTGGPQSLLWQSHAVGPLQWRLVLLRDPQPLRQAAWVAATAAALGVGLLAALAALVVLRQRRRRELRHLHDTLEHRIAERTADLSRQVLALERTEGILRQTQDSAVQAGKLAVLGQMAAGMTHELNQPLAALHAYADNASALLQRGDTAAVSENLHAISHLAGRLGRLVGQLKAFSRKVPLERTRVPLDAALANALLIVESKRKELATVIDTSAVQPGLAALAETVRLEQVLVNLLRNALDATAQTPHRQVRVTAQLQLGQLQVQVLDNGPGLSPSVAAHLFEPFFTTKGAVAGLGLGLAISQAIVEGFGGRLEATNQPGGGAAFSIWLPAPAVSNAETKEDHHDGC